ncbi:TIGR01244 family sulfur transferase [Pseudomarimonas arenosa]|uniref:TIGR01244 family phosphatase n=1 Tax=Pseudomarimonas arenosa TaxID=2774145 RepID=A0AAW3ZJ48_9GAMM|nr:TIGR01244 family sulfur transferase [Pseudomarimonas arenosa]MBD8525249.1 TIGR01244 family phosphatase [Pseudomarimonas arenosa]
MTLRPQALESRLAVAAQISTADVTAIAAAGYRALICNRPDGESDDQCDAATIAAAAQAQGLPFRYLPVLGSAIDSAAIAAFRQALNELPTPILAYCRSGNRSTLLWALAEAGRRPLAEIESRAAAAGISLTDLQPRLQRLAEGL